MHALPSFDCRLPLSRYHLRIEFYALVTWALNSLAAQVHTTDHR